MKKNLSLIFTLFLFISFASCSISTNTTYDKSFFAEFTKLNVSLASESISIIETRNSDFAIEIACNDKNRQPNVYTTDDTIEIVAKRNFTIIPGFRCHVYLYIPEGYKFEDIDISLSSGSLEADVLTSSEVYITSSSGSIKIRKIESDDKVRIKTTSGSIKINKIYADLIDLESTSGSISSDTIDTYSFDAETTSGSMEFNSFFCDSFTLQSTSGSILLDFYDVPEAKSSIETTSGSVKLFIPTDKQFSLDYNTSSGSFTDGRNGNRIRSNGSIYQPYNGGGVEIYVSTTSGSLYIDD